MSDAVRTVALSEGMDPSASPTLLWPAIRLRRAQEMRSERDRAALLFNLACFHLAHGKDMSYWDVAGHLYPSDFVRRQRENVVLSRQRAQQMETLEALKQYQMVMEEQRRLKHAGPV